ncbi:MAG: hypothetical protein CM1200mP39_03390 [Dehalococcoidia bacterium]|nr:MAG: hypothetical protein CM1200mP39_03390 [Dehalococcoidia bacterium]
MPIRSVFGGLSVLEYFISLMELEKGLLNSVRTADSDI